MDTLIGKHTSSLIEGMFKVGAHFGFSRSRRHPSFASVIFGSKNGTDIINLEKTGVFLAQAVDFAKKMGSENKVLLFVGTKPEARRVVEEAALSCGAPSVSRRWIGGTLTNFTEIKKRMSLLDSLQKKREAGELDVYTKKEQLGLHRQIIELLQNFGGIAALAKTPDAIFVVDPRHEHTAVDEARKRRIPVIALAGPDCDITAIDYAIPANDSSLQSITFFVEQIARAYEDGKKNASVKKEEGVPGVPAAL